MAVRQTGAARWFTETILGGPTREVESNPNILTTVTAATSNNPDRVGLIFVNNGNNDIYIGLTPSVSPTNGIKLTANGGNVTMQVRDDFTLPARLWWAIANGGASLLYVLEQISDVLKVPEQTG